MGGAACLSRSVPLKAALPSLLEGKGNPTNPTRFLGLTPRSPALEGRVCYTQTLSWEPQGTVPLRTGQGHCLSHGSWARREPYNLRVLYLLSPQFPSSFGWSPVSEHRGLGAWSFLPFLQAKERRPGAYWCQWTGLCDSPAFTIGQHFLSPDKDKCW